jgi:hypothetical protein
LASSAVVVVADVPVGVEVVRGRRRCLAVGVVSVVPVYVAISVDVVSVDVADGVAGCRLSRRCR